MTKGKKSKLKEMSDERELRSAHYEMGPTFADDLN